MEYQEVSILKGIHEDASIVTVIQHPNERGTGVELRHTDIPDEAYLKPVHRGMLAFTGFSILAPRVMYGQVRRTAEERAAALDEWSEWLKGIFAEAPIQVDSY
jgi:putative NADPH-quinone reductase